jgi:hypothetical protein
MADTVDHTHGDTGTKPADGLNFANGDLPDPEVFDWFWTEVPKAINDHAALLEEIDSNGDGVVDQAAQADNATNVKGNDIDSDADGKVDAAETADTAKTTLRIEARTDYPTDPEVGRVVFRTDKTV